MKKLLFILSIFSVFSFIFISCDDISNDEICDNHTDDDSDGFADCADQDCIGKTGPFNIICEATEISCCDMYDNDNDGYIDLVDSDCFAANCEIPEEVCGVKGDEDNDGFDDCADSDCIASYGPEGVVCEATELSCTDTFDNDGDEKPDCEDSDCTGKIGPDNVVCEATEITCDDLIDNDGDGLIDCGDENCIGKMGSHGDICSATEIICDDWIDNDGDSLVDCKDPDCNGIPGQGGGICQISETICDDKYDNDHNGVRDCAELSCDGIKGPDDGTCQAVESLCEDDYDNDGDGLWDCSDPNCIGVTLSSSPIECESVELSCDDGFDNDGDGNSDCDDFDCKMKCIHPGSLLITEIMKNPSYVLDNYGEWFEVYNTTDKAIDLSGLVLFSDENESRTIDSTLIINAYSYEVFAKNGDNLLNGDVTPLYVYGNSLNLSQNVDSIGIKTPEGFIIDQVVYDSTSFPNISGFSLSLDGSSLDATLNDDFSNWCINPVKYNPLDSGSPNHLNPTCLRESNCSDNIDNDQNGKTDCMDFYCSFSSDCTLEANVPVYGDLIVTEFLANAGLFVPIPVLDYEWIEIFNTTAHDIELNGLFICKKKGSSDEICFVLHMETSTLLSSGSYYLFVSNLQKTVGDFEYRNSLWLHNSNDEIKIFRETQDGTQDGTQILIHQIVYDETWNITPQYSTQFSSSANHDGTNASDKSNWCNSLSVYDSTNMLYGTPNSANADCN
jgi:Lamin Tail Domain